MRAAARIHLRQAAIGLLKADADIVGQGLERRDVEQVARSRLPPRVSLFSTNASPAVRNVISVLPETVVTGASDKRQERSGLALLSRK